MIWRERLLEARKRGSSTREDRDLFQNTETCPAAEVAEAYGQRYNHEWLDLWSIGTLAFVALLHNDFDEVEMLLDKIEDMALVLKTRT